MRSKLTLGSDLALRVLPLRLRVAVFFVDSGFWGPKVGDSKVQVAGFLGFRPPTAIPLAQEPARSSSVGGRGGKGGGGQGKPQEHLAAQL